MNLSPKTELAIKIIKVIGYTPNIQSKIIGEMFGVSEYIIRRICKKLVDAGLLIPIRGSRGGYNAKDLITVFEVLEVMEPKSFTLKAKSPEPSIELDLDLIKSNIVAALHQVYVI